MIQKKELFLFILRKENIRGQKYVKAKYKLSRIQRDTINRLFIIKLTISHGMIIILIE